MVVPTKTALFTMVNTDPKCFWLTNFLETLLVQAGKLMAKPGRFHEQEVPSYLFTCVESFLVCGSSVVASYLAEGNIERASCNPCFPAFHRGYRTT